jgi:hypothetical protein
MITAGVHSRLIDEGKRIKHGAWAALYLFIACGFSWVYTLKLDRRFSIELLIALLCIRMVFFTLTLNRMRGLSLWYVTPELRNVTSLLDAIKKGRFIDYVHYKLFGKKVWLYMAIYLFIAVYILIKSPLIFYFNAN